jgi:hypothetical protein
MRFDMDTWARGPISIFDGRNNVAAVTGIQCRQPESGLLPLKLRLTQAAEFPRPVTKVVVEGILP